MLQPKGVSKSNLQLEPEFKIKTSKWGRIRSIEGHLAISHEYPEGFDYFWIRRYGKSSTILYINGDVYSISNELYKMSGFDDIYKSILADFYKILEAMDIPALDWLLQEENSTDLHTLHTLLEFHVSCESKRERELLVSQNLDVTNTPCELIIEHNGYIFTWEKTNKQGILFLEKQWIGLVLQTDPYHALLEIISTIWKYEDIPYSIIKIGRYLRAQYFTTVNLISLSTPALKN
jgi:hemin uptake protein HemP